MPLYSDVLQNTNSNAPCLNVNDLQIQGFGIFADTAARDALNETIRTEGYVASMKDDDKLYVYASSDFGDTAWQDAANWVAIGSGGGGSFRAIITGSASVNSEIVEIIGFDSSAGLPQVTGNNESPAEESEGALMAGVVVSGSSGDEVDVLVSGEYEDFRFAVDVGVTPTPGQIIYGGLGSQPYVGILGDETFAIGRLLGDFTLEQSYPGFFDVYRGRVYLSMPVMNAFYDDSVSYYESQRFYAFESGTVEVGEIVKYVSIDSIIRVSRWDSSSGDTVDDIAGVTTSGRASSEPYSSVCNSGSVRYDLSVIGGATPVAGGIIYADSTNSYELTTASTSGVKIGLVQNVDTINSYVRINLKFI